MSGLRVSNTALVQWLDRMGVIDAAMLREALATSLAKAAAAAASIDADNYAIVSGGLLYHVREGLLVRVVSSDSVAQHFGLLAPIGEGD